MSELEPPFAVVEAVEGTPWMISVDDAEPSELPERLELWEPSRTIRAWRSVILRPTEIIEATGLSPSSKVRLLGGWSCDATRTRTFENYRTISLDEHDWEIDLDIEVPGPDIARVVDFVTILVLVETEGPNRAGVAHLPGSILFEEQASLPIEGVASRFPMEWVSFQEMGLPPEAAWHLDWEPGELDVSVLGGIRLYLNKGHASLPTVLDKRSKESDAVNEALRLDMVRQLILGSLAADAPGSEGHEEGTVGRLVQRMRSIYLPGHTAESMRHLARTDPARFESMLQASSGFLRRDSR